MNIKTFFYLMIILFASNFTQAKASELTEKDYCQNIENFQFGEYLALKCFSEVLLTEDYSKIDKYENMKTSEDFKSLYEFYFSDNYDDHHHILNNKCIDKSEIHSINTALGCSLISAIYYIDKGYIQINNFSEKENNIQYHLLNPIHDFSNAIVNLNAANYLSSIINNDIDIHLINLYRNSFNIIDIFIQARHHKDLKNYSELSNNMIYDEVIRHSTGFMLERSRYESGNHASDNGIIDDYMINHQNMFEADALNFHSSIIKDADKGLYHDSFAGYMEFKKTCNNLDNKADLNLCSIIPPKIVSKAAELACDLKFAKASVFSQIEDIKVSKGYLGCISDHTN